MKVIINKKKTAIIMCLAIFSLSMPQPTQAGWFWPDSKIPLPPEPNKWDIFVNKVLPPALTTATFVGKGIGTAATFAFHEVKKHPYLIASLLLTYIIQKCIREYITRDDIKLFNKIKSLKQKTDVETINSLMFEIERQIRDIRENLSSMDSASLQAITNNIKIESPPSTVIQTQDNNGTSSTTSNKNFLYKTFNYFKTFTNHFSKTKTPQEKYAKFRLKYTVLLMKLYNLHDVLNTLHKQLNNTYFLKLNNNKNYINEKIELLQKRINTLLEVYELTFSQDYDEQQIRKERILIKSIRKNINKNDEAYNLSDYEAKEMSHNELETDEDKNTGL